MPRSRTHWRRQTITALRYGTVFGKPGVWFWRGCEQLLLLLVLVLPMVLMRLVQWLSCFLGVDWGLRIALWVRAQVPVLKQLHFRENDCRL